LILINGVTAKNAKDAKNGVFRITATNRKTTARRTA